MSFIEIGTGKSNDVVIAIGPASVDGVEHPGRVIAMSAVDALTMAARLIFSVGSLGSARFKAQTLRFETENGATLATLEGEPYGIVKFEVETVVSADARRGA